jgi:hypothetical protein
VYCSNTKTCFISVRMQGSFVYSQRIESYWSPIFLYLHLSTVLRKISRCSTGCFHSFDTRWRRVVIQAPASSPPEKKTGIHLMRHWVGPMEGLGVLERGKISPPTRIRSQDRPARSLVVIPTMVFWLHTIIIIITIIVSYS